MIFSILEYCFLFGAWRSLASALDWGSRGRRFKSCRPESILSSFYDVRLGIYLEWSVQFNSRGKWSGYVLGLSPRERTGAASAILEAESSIVRTVTILDI